MSNKTTYLQFCEKEKELPIFFQPWYLDAVCGAAGWDILLVKKGDQVAAVMPIQVHRKFGFSLRRMPPLTKYWGPYFIKNFRSEKQQQRMMRELIKQIPALDYFEQFFQPSITNWLPFYWKGFEATARYTFVIDLKDSLENIYGRITANYRNNKIKKAEQIVEVVSDRSLEDFYAVQKKSFDRQQISMPFSFDFLKKLDVALEEKDSRKIFFAVDEKNQIHSALYLTWDSEKAYLLMIGDDAELRSSGAGILLTWHSIKYAKEVLQKKQFDFLGSMLEPVANIRRDFGAEQIPYFEVKKYNSKLIKFYFLLKKWRNQK